MLRHFELTAVAICLRCVWCVSVGLSLCVCDVCGCMRASVCMSVCTSFQLTYVHTCCVISLGSEVGCIWNLKDPGNLLESLQHGGHVLATLMGSPKWQSDYLCTYVPLSNLPL